MNRMGIVAIIYVGVGGMLASLLAGHAIISSQDEKWAKERHDCIEDPGCDAGKLILKQESERGNGPWASFVTVLMVGSVLAVSYGVIALAR